MKKITEYIPIKKIMKLFNRENTPKIEVIKPDGDIVYTQCNHESIPECKINGSCIPSGLAPRYCKHCYLEIKS